MVDITTFGVVMGSVSGPMRIANATNFQTALDTVFANGGGTIEIPGGQLQLDGALKGKHRVSVRGEGAYATVLDFFNGSGDFAIDLVGGQSDPIICTWSDLCVNGVHGHDNLQGIRVGHNYRSAPLLERLKLWQFGHYAINLDANNWNVSFVDIELDACGKRANNSCGIYKNPSVTDLNYINFTRAQIEGCGTPNSAAGGLNIQTTTLSANRGWQFTDCIIEGNVGTDEAYFANMRSVNFENLYLEREPDSGETGSITGLEFSNVTGKISGGVVIGTPSIPLYGLQFKNGSAFSIRDVQFEGWGGAGIDVYGSTVTTGRNSTTMSVPLLRIDGSAEPRGVLAPRFAATRSSSQSVPDATPTRVGFDTIDYDVTNAFDTAQARYTPQTTGMHRLSGAVTFTSMAAGSVTLSIRANGSPIRSQTFAAAALAKQSFEISADVEVHATTDYFELFVEQSTGTARSIPGDPTASFFSGALIQ